MAYAQERAFEQKRRAGGERLDVLSPVTFRRRKGSLGQADSHGVAMDMSTLGIYIQTRNKMPINDNIDMLVDLIQLSDQVTVSGTVVRADEAGIAIEFHTPCERMQYIRAG